MRLICQNPLRRHHECWSDTAKDRKQGFQADIIKIHQPRRKQTVIPYMSNQISLNHINIHQRLATKPLHRRSSNRYSVIQPPLKTDFEN